MPLDPAAQRAIEALPGVSLEELDERAELLRRVDTKYALDGDQFARLVGRLADHQVLEIEGRRGFGYESVYFDTPDLRCFRDHVEDRTPRFKARTRLYRDTGKCVFEVKLKPAEGETDKRQVPHPADANDQLDERARDCLTEALEGAGLPALDEPLERSLRTRFTRVTLSPAEGAERTTCDFEIELQRPGAGKARLRDRWVIVETKSENGKSPADEVIADLGVEPISLSKYRTGMALLAPNVRDPESPRAAEDLFEVEAG